MSVDKEKYEEKYRKYKLEKENLFNKNQDLDYQVKNLLMEKNMILGEKAREDEYKKQRAENKCRILSDMQHTISSYKKDLLVNRIKKKDEN